ncbi:RNA polymerase sigma factor [Bacillus sp. KH172YL63]|uniref:RNA polymerase sigma factor n=1 Tax=Bacillus sp. KH172YL63 TaxID=2709784 RepID=UPI0013E4A84B|nr:RNA polymerase sigma factor [Bacillus sp. KH172YL63]BCB05426.1 RNA polymerase sigma factor [Bacillus sp. KH172YL63]
MEDEHLISQAKKGDLTAYGQLIGKYSPVVERFAYQMGHSYGDIPDIAQKVFLRVYRFLDGFSYAKFTSWLYKITLNVSRDFKRKEYQYFLKIRSIKKQAEQEAETPHGQLLKDEEDRMLHECIQALDEKYRIPIILHYFHEKKYEEMADILSIPLSTVKTRLLRGKNLLKKRLEQAEKREGKRNG